MRDLRVMRRSSRSGDACLTRAACLTRCTRRSAAGPPAWCKSSGRRGRAPPTTSLVIASNRPRRPTHRRGRSRAASSAGPRRTAGPAAGGRSCRKRWPGRVRPPVSQRLGSFLAWARVPAAVSAGMRPRHPPKAVPCDPGTNRAAAHRRSRETSQLRAAPLASCIPKVLVEPRKRVRIMHGRPTAAVGGHQMGSPD